LRPHTQFQILVMRIDQFQGPVTCTEQGLTPGVLIVVSDRQPFNGPTAVSLVPSGDPRIVGRDLAQLLWCREVPVEDRGRPAA